MKILLPEKVTKIINTLEEAGYKAYAVGGCVRDTVLGKEPEDWDITTSAIPQEIKALFTRTIDTGIEHGTVTIMLGDDGFEVTTYRIDGEYTDSRHPLEVTFTANLIEDLKRRDFTINAMAYNDKVGLVDEFEGLKDMKAQVIRCVGNPIERFSEDALRIMRAIRFSAQLGYCIEEETKIAIKELAPTLVNISVERIQVELVKTLLSPNPMFLKMAYEMGVTKVILPEFDKMMETTQNHIHHCHGVGEHSLYGAHVIAPKKVLRLGMLFHDIGKPVTQTTDEEGIQHFYGHPKSSEKMTKEILKRLHFDNDTISQVSKIALYHDIEIVCTPKAIRKVIYKVGEELFPLLLQIKKADIMAQSQYKQEEKLNYLNEIETLYQVIVQDKDCVSLKNLQIRGKDLIEIGMQPGKEIGIILQILLAMVIDDPSLNHKDILIEKAKELK